jgi:hypothetical protein
MDKTNIQITVAGGSITNVNADNPALIGEVVITDVSKELPVHCIFENDVEKTDVAALITSLSAASDEEVIAEAAPQTEVISAEVDVEEEEEVAE